MEFCETASKQVHYVVSLTLLIFSHSMNSLYQRFCTATTTITSISHMNNNIWLAKFAKLRRSKLRHSSLTSRIFFSINTFNTSMFPFRELHNQKPKHADRTSLTRFRDQFYGNDETHWSKANIYDNTQLRHPVRGNETQSSDLRQWRNSELRFDLVITSHYLTAFS